MTRIQLFFLATLTLSTVLTSLEKIMSRRVVERFFLNQTEELTRVGHQLLTNEEPQQQVLQQEDDEQKSEYVKQVSTDINQVSNEDEEQKSEYVKQVSKDVNQVSKEEEEEKLHWIYKRSTKVCFFDKTAAAIRRKRAIEDSRKDRVSANDIDYADWSALVDGDKKSIKKGVPEYVLNCRTIVKDFAGSKVINCGFCLYPINKDDKIRILPCEHMFHKDEIDEWLKYNNTCIVCRVSLLD